MHLNIPARSYTNRLHWLFPVEGDQKLKKKKLLRHLGHHMEHWQEAESKKHVLSLNT
jgi:hypothetical protein